MKLKIYASAVIALASMAVGTLSAKAAAVTNYQDGDIFLGIRGVGDTGTGGTIVYLLNLGSYTQFTNATASFEVANLLTDLNAIYGINEWQDRSTLQWGVFGAYAHDPDGSVRSLYASRLSATPWSARTFTQANTTLTGINTVRNSFNGSESVPGNPNATTQPTSGVGATYWNAVNAGTDFNTASGWSGTGIEGAINQQLYFYGQTTGSATQFLGTFSLSDEGILTFNVNAVPEPSSAMLLGLAGTALLVFRRRRLQQLQS